MSRIVDPLSQMGAKIIGQEQSNKLYAPLKIKPSSNLKGIQYTLPMPSAQVKSAVLLASLYADGETLIKEPIPCRNHTEVMLKTYQANINVNHSMITCDGTRVLENPFDHAIRIPSDFSSAAFFIVLGLLMPNSELILRNIGLNPTRSRLINILVKMGAKISGHGTETVEIEGVSELNGTHYSVLPDRIETGTFLVAGAITGGKIKIKNTVSEHVGVIIEKLREAGAKIDVTPTTINLDMKGRRPKPIDIETGPYPKFPTDMQAQITALNSIASGKSQIKENIFENRFMHVQEMNRMGANIIVKNNCAHVVGVESLIGAPVMATDLRASASLILAGLIASGTTEIGRIYHIDRGYDCIEEKLRQLGAKIERVPM